MSVLRAELYHDLAEALAEPPDWLALPGRAWPLYASAARLASESAAAGRALAALGRVGAEPLAQRRARYAALFAGPGRPSLWLYESQALGGRLFGPQTQAVARVFRAAGLEPAGAELADHAALELAFMGELARRGGARPSPAERRFLREHAGRWLPRLGRALARTGDPVYGPIGRLLADWLSEAARRPDRQPHWLPALREPEACHLCGFCSQVCAPQALALCETRTTTALMLTAGACSGCRQCERVCPDGLITGTDGLADGLAASAGARAVARAVASERAPNGPRVLRQSPRPPCRGCGQPLASQAELDFVARRIGPADWLGTCGECRERSMEGLA
jgi:TorA maturation chaperone TorD/NAD-dependent dihydropyrimidine dehydrogenase PreA subunit